MIVKTSKSPDPTKRPVPEVRSYLELELALRGFVRRDDRDGAPTWTRSARPFVDVTVGNDQRVLLGCKGVGSATVEEVGDGSDVLRIVDEWVSADETARRRRSRDQVADRASVMATVVEELPADPVRAEAALSVVHDGPAPVVPGELWQLLSDQFGHVRELSDQLASARERAVRAETEAEFLKARLRELDGANGHGHGAGTAVPAAGVLRRPRSLLGRLRRSRRSQD